MLALTDEKDEPGYIQELFRRYVALMKETESCISDMALLDAHTSRVVFLKVSLLQSGYQVIWVENEPRLERKKS